MIILLQLQYYVNKCNQQINLPRKISNLQYFQSRRSIQQLLNKKIFQNYQKTCLTKIQKFQQQIQMLIQNNAGNKKDQNTQFPQLIGTQSNQKSGIVKNVRITLTMDDIMKNVGQLSKEQIIEKFRLLLDRKQMQINEKIQRNNIDHLLLLQKKMLTLENKTYQNFKLNNQITTLKKQLSDQKSKNIDITEHNEQLINRTKYLERTKIQCDETLKQQKVKREKLKKQNEQLKASYKNLNYTYQEQIRNSKKLREQKKNFDQQLDLLLKNQMKIYDTEMQGKLNNIQLNCEYKINQSLAAFHEEKKKSQSFQSKYMQAKNKINKLNKAMEVVNRQLMNQKNKQLLMQKQKPKDPMISKSIKIQSVDQITCTQDCLLQQAFLGRVLFRKQFLDSYLEDIKKGVIQSYIQVTNKKQCQKCKILKKNNQNLQHQINVLKKKPKQIVYTTKQKQYSTPSKQTIEKVVPQFNSLGTQTVDITKAVYQSIGTQKTSLQSLDKQQQLKIIQDFNSIKKSSYKLIQNWKKRYEQLQEIYQRRPSKNEDIAKINQMEKQMIKLNFWLGEKQKCIVYQQEFISRLQNKLSQQFVILDQVHIQQLQIKNTKTNRNTIQNKTINRFLNNSLSRNRNRTSKLQIDSQLQSKSKTCSFISQPYTSQMSRTRKLSRQRNSINSSTIQKQFSSNTKIPYTPDKIDEQYKNSLFLKGIVFTEENKDYQQLSRLRKYKKYKSSYKKFRQS